MRVRRLLLPNPIQTVDDLLQGHARKHHFAFLLYYLGLKDFFTCNWEGLRSLGKRVERDSTTSTHDSPWKYPKWVSIYSW